MKLRHRLKLWLSDLRLELVLHWHSVRAAVAERLAPAEYEIQVEWTPLYRGQPFRNSEPEPEDRVFCRQAPASHCVNCGHTGSVIVADGAEPIDPGTEIFDMLECPECGLFTMCSD
jgi:rubredoxin